MCVRKRGRQSSLLDGNSSTYATYGSLSSASLNLCEPHLARSIVTVNQWPVVHYQVIEDIGSPLTHPPTRPGVHRTRCLRQRATPYHPIVKEWKASSSPPVYSNNQLFIYLPGTWCRADQIVWPGSTTGWSGATIQYQHR